MAETPLQIQLKNELSEFALRSKLMNNAFKIGGERLTRLVKEKLYIETLVLVAQTAEHYLKILVDGYASRRRVLELLGEKDIYASVKLYVDDEIPLGGMIGILKKLQVDSTLIYKLSELNELRKEAVHHIFDGTKDIAKFETRVEAYLGTEIPNLMEAIHTAQTKVAKEIKQFTDPVLLDENDKYW